VSLSAEIKSLAIRLGADLIGVAPIERFESAPEPGKPRFYMSKAESVVVIATRVLKGLCEAHGAYDEPGKTIGPYMWYGYPIVNWSNSWIAFQIGQYLEDQGYKALPFPPTGFIYRNPEEGQPDFYHKHAAVAAGLGEFGLNRLLLTPQFGAHQRLVSLITDAALDPDPMYNGPPLCNPKACGETCIKACPMKAFEDKMLSVKIGGRIFQYRVLDSVVCRWHSIGGRYLRGNENLPRYPDHHQIEEITEKLGGSAKVNEKMNPNDKALQQFTFAPTCGACMTKCRAPWK
jgi:epoxyqueuosine reductase